jgi:hypothetical protein
MILTYHKSIILDDVALYDLAVLLEEWLNVGIGGLISQVADEDFEGTHATKTRHYFGSFSEPAQPKVEKNR